MSNYKNFVEYFKQRLNRISQIRFILGYPVNDTFSLRNLSYRENPNQDNSWVISERTPNIEDLRSPELYVDIYSGHNGNIVLKGSVHRITSNSDGSSHSFSFILIPRITDTLLMEGKILYIDETVITDCFAHF